jgi:5-methylcytosine-specific restriction endonuclease McrA
MYRDGQIVCDACQSVVTKVSPPPEDGWPNLHALCRGCFDKKSATKV